MFVDIETENVLRGARHDRMAEENVVHSVTERRRVVRPAKEMLELERQLFCPSS